MKAEKDEFFTRLFVSKNRFEPLFELIGIIIQSKLKTPLYAISKGIFDDY